MEKKQKNALAFSILSIGTIIISVTLVKPSEMGAIAFIIGIGMVTTASAYLGANTA